MASEEIPRDVMKAAMIAYDTPISGDASLNSIVNKYAEDCVKFAIARAILSERERCANVADDYELAQTHPRLSPGSEMNASWSGQELASSRIAHAIRTPE